MIFGIPNSSHPEGLRFPYRPTRGGSVRFDAGMKRFLFRVSISARPALMEDHLTDALVRFGAQRHPGEVGEFECYLPSHAHSKGCIEVEPHLAPRRSHDHCGAVAG